MLSLALLAVAVAPALAVPMGQQLDMERFQIPVDGRSQRSVCSDANQRCILGMHTGASDCLKEMFNDPLLSDRRCSQFGNTTMRMFGEQMFDASTAWHDAMRECVSNPMGASLSIRDSPCPSDSDFDRIPEPLTGNSAVDSCFAKKEEEKRNCLGEIALPERAGGCPRLAACMGIGETPRTRDGSADWYCHVRGLRLQTKRLFSRYSAQGNLCRGSL